MNTLNLTREIRCKRVGSAAAVMPRYAKEGDAGLDLFADIDGTRGHLLKCSWFFRDTLNEILVIDPGGAALVPTGWALEVPCGYEGQVRPKSGLSSKFIDVILGTVDSGYRGEILVHVRNSSDRHMYIRTGDRIAQLVIAPVVRATLREAEELSESERGEGGFGSTGR